jgi:hypothetical protein
MILYLSRNESTNLPGNAINEKSMPVRRITGSFCLSEFITLDMRRYAGCQYFCVERDAVMEDDAAFLQALQSFQMMYSARIIIIYERENEADSFARELVKIGVFDIVTAPDIGGKLEQIGECLSDEGMQRYRSRSAPTQAELKHKEGLTFEEKATLGQSLMQTKQEDEQEDEQYRFDCMNVRIGLIGATRRVGTTTAALGLANFIQNHGGTACYAALNTHSHLESIAADYGFDAGEDYYTWDGIDFCQGIMPRYDYNFIISDFGEIKREAVRMFRESDVHLLCGAGNTRFEVMELAEALKAVKSVKPKILVYDLNPEYGELFRSVVTKEPPMAIRPSKDMMDFKTNALVFNECPATR